MYQLWSPPFYYPTPNTLAYSENLFGVAPVYWLCRTALPADLAYQIWMMTICALTFLGAALLMRVIGITHLLCALGGYWSAFPIHDANGGYVLTATRALTFETTKHYVGSPVPLRESS